MSTYKTPGVYTEEVSILPPSVAPVETAIPAFLGYTEKRPANTAKAYRISSMTEYHDLFGGAYPEPFPGITVSKGEEYYSVENLPDDPGSPEFWLYYQLQMFYANGGGACYIIPINTYSNSTPNDWANGFSALRKEDEPTLIILADLPKVSNVDDFHGYYKDALAQCAALKDRFTIMDVKQENDPVGVFRNKIGANFLSYGAAYHPWLETTLRYAYDESKIAVDGAEGTELEADTRLKYDTSDLSMLPDVEGEDKRTYYESRSLFHLDNRAYTQINEAINGFRLTLPPSSTMAGIYAQVDGSRGVFKAPANVSLNKVIRPVEKISNEDQENLNVHPTGKSINAIRSFIGKGVMVWGARTLDGNSNEWRYVSVRRFFIFAEESINKSIERFVFEPNNESTWVKIKGTIENFLTGQWQAGALAGSTEEQAFFVRVGLGITMTAQDILEGRLIVTVGLAAVRPAEFIILRFSHKLQEA